MNFKHILFAALIAGGGSAMAQNTATSNTFGTLNNATVTQTGNNTSTIDQGTSLVATKDNDATVTQSGANTSDIDQTGVAGGNAIVVSQLGTTNSSLVLQAGADNVGGIDQGAVAGSLLNNGTSTSNTAKMDQYGDDNAAQISQGVNGGTSTSNTAWTRQFPGNTNGSATVNQGNGNIASGNQGEVYQRSGDGNVGTINQGNVGVAATGNQALIDQTGDMNAGTITQQGTSSLAYVAAGKIDLSIAAAAGPGAAAAVTFFTTTGTGGANNEASILQTATSNQNLGAIAQVGNNNDSYVEQSGMGGLVAIVQNGDLNEAGTSAATIKQAGIGNTLLGQQVGNSNKLSASVKGNNNLTTVDQAGNSNRASFTLGSTGSAGNVASIAQSGNSNAGSFQIVSGSNNGATAKGALSITQTGNSASANIEIAGSGNSAIVAQAGTGNKTYYNLRGSGPGSPPGGQPNDDNVLRITQGAGSNNISTGYISGDRNSITTMQTGNGNNAGAPQYAANGVNLYGDDNVASVTQAGNTNEAFIDVNSSDNMSSIDQAGDSNDAMISQQSALGMDQATINQTGNLNNSTINQN